MKKLVIFSLIICLSLTSCASNNNLNVEVDGEERFISSEIQEESTIDIQDEQINTKQEEKTEDILNEINIEFEEPNFTGFNDPNLISYIESDIYAQLENELENEDFIIENVQAVYLSDEYIEELTYNSKENVFFGYTLSELDERFGEKKYCFTLGDDGTTIVKEFEGHDDSFEKMVKNVAIGTGIIVVCVAVTYATGGAAVGTALETVNIVFSTAAKDAILFAKIGTPIGALAGGIIEKIKNKDSDFSDIIKSSLLGATEGYKIGAIIGATVGSTRSALSQYLKKVETIETIEELLNDPNISLPRKAELRTKKIFGGKEQVSFLAGEEVGMGTPGATRPDIVRYVDGKLEAIEVKYYNLSSPQSLETLFRELKREVSSRVINLPEGSLQRIVLDVTDRGFSKELVDNVSEKIIVSLMDIYPNIPITIVGL